MQSRVRQLHLRLDPRELGDSKSSGLAGGVPHECGLADPRLTMDDQGRALAPAHVLQQPVQQVALADPAAQHRRALGGHSLVERKRPGTRLGTPLV